MNAKTVGEIIKDRDIYAVRKDQTVQEAVEKMVERNIGALPVLDGKRLVGIFSERDLMTRVVARGLDARRTKVGDVMTKEVVACEIGEGYDACLARMQQHNCRHLPITSGHDVVGFISMRDLLLVDRDEKQKEIEMLDLCLQSTL
mgnify:CR=1 FL=1